MNDIQLNTSVSTEFMDDFYCIETYINEDGDVCEKNTRIPMQEAINKLKIKLSTEVNLNNIEPYSLP